MSWIEKRRLLRQAGLEYGTGLANQIAAAIRPDASPDTYADVMADNLAFVAGIYAREGCRPREVKAFLEAARVAAARRLREHAAFFALARTEHDPVQ